MDVSIVTAVTLSPLGHMCPQVMDTHRPRLHWTRAFTLSSHLGQQSGRELSRDSTRLKPQFRDQGTAREACAPVPLGVGGRQLRCRKHEAVVPVWVFSFLRRGGLLASPPPHRWARVSCLPGPAASVSTAWPHLVHQQPLPTPLGRRRLHETLG